MTEEEMEREIDRNTPYSYDYLGTINFLESDESNDVRHFLLQKAMVMTTSTNYGDRISAQKAIASVLREHDLLVNGSAGVPIKWILREIKRVCS